MKAVNPNHFICDGWRTKTYRDFIMETEEILSDVVNTISETEGDMWLSQYSKLCSLRWTVVNTKHFIEEKEQKK